MGNHAGIEQLLGAVVQSLPKRVIDEERLSDKRCRCNRIAQLITHAHHEVEITDCDDSGRKRLSVVLEVKLPRRLRLQRSFGVAFE